MPKLTLTIPDTDETVVRPVVNEITRQLFDITGISKDTSILYPGLLEKTFQKGSSIGEDDGTAKLPFTDQVTVEVEENYEADRLLSTAIFRPENLFIYRDDALYAYIKPAYSPTDVTVNFRYRAKDKTTAQRWRDDIRARVSLMRAERVHELTYSYLIPPELLVILKEIHRLRENVMPYGEDYDTYFKNYSTQRASLQSNLSGSQTAWAIAETQQRVMGWFDMSDGVPEQGARDDDGDTWTISFSYKFKYDKPIACVMAYPLVVHNQVLSDKFRPSEVPYRPEDHYRSYALSAKNFSVFEKGQTSACGDPGQGIAIPAFDDFLPEQVVNPSLRIFTALITIDSTNPLWLLSLKNLGDWKLDDDIVDFLVGEAPYLTSRMRSIFCLNLYQGPALLADGLLTVDADLNVNTIRPLPLRDYYHLRLGIVRKLNLLEPAALVRLRNHAAALIKILTAIDPSLACEGRLPPILGDNYIRKSDLDSIIDYLNRADLSQGDGQTRQFNTVQTLFVVSDRIENAAR